MSQVSTWVEATDGMVYQDPVLTGEGWYVCFDDDEPPELVIKKHVRRTPQQILQDAGIPWKFIRALKSSGLRMFENEKFEEAKACFFELNGPIPVPQKFNARHANPQGQGVYYTFTKKRSL